jgi:hypothetical protein
MFCNRGMTKTSRNNTPGVRGHSGRSRTARTSVNDRGLSESDMSSSAKREWPPVVEVLHGPAKVLCGDEMAPQWESIFADIASRGGCEMRVGQVLANPRWCVESGREPSGPEQTGHEVHSRRRQGYNVTGSQILCLLSCTRVVTPSRIAAHHGCPRSQCRHRRCDAAESRRGSKGRGK